MTKEERQRRLLTFESNAGRELGWVLELDGRRLARLTDVRFEEMFWDSYWVTPLDDSEETARLLSSAEHWQRAQFTFRNQGTGELVDGAFSAGGLPPQGDPPRVVMRALSSRLSPALVERILLALRTARRRLTKF